MDVCQGGSRRVHIICQVAPGDVGRPSCMDADAIGKSKSANSGLPILKRQGTFVQKSGGKAEQLSLADVPRRRSSADASPRAILASLQNRPMPEKADIVTESDEEAAQDTFVMPEAPVRMKSGPPMLKRQGTFVQKSGGASEEVDLSETPRRRSSSGNDEEAKAIIELKRQRSHGLDDAQTDQQQQQQQQMQDDMIVEADEEEEPTAGADAFEMPAPSRAKKGPPVLKRQGTFVQKSGGGSEQIDLTEASPRRRSSSGSDDETKSIQELKRQRSQGLDKLDDVVQESDSDEAEEEQEQVELVRPRPTERPVPRLPLKPAPMMKRQGTFIQKKNGAAEAIEIPLSPTHSGDSVEVVADIRRRKDSNNSVVDAVEEADSEEDNDGPADSAQEVPPAGAATDGKIGHPATMNRKGTFFQSSSGVSSAISLSMDLLVAHDSRRLSAIVDSEADGDEDDVDAGTRTPDDTGSDHETRRRSLSDAETGASSTSPKSSLGSSAGGADLTATVVESMALNHSTARPAAASAYQRKGTFVQTANGAAGAILLSKSAPVGLSAMNLDTACDAIAEEDAAEQHPPSAEQPLPSTTEQQLQPAKPSPAPTNGVNDGVTNRRSSLNKSHPSVQDPPRGKVDKAKRAAYLSNRKGTFAANEQGKMIKVALQDQDSDMMVKKRAGGAGLGRVVEQTAEDTEEEIPRPKAPSVIVTKSESRRLVASARGPTHDRQHTFMMSSHGSMAKITLGNATTEACDLTNVHGLEEDNDVAPSVSQTARKPLTSPRPVAEPILRMFEEADRDRRERQTELRRVDRHRRRSVHSAHCRKLSSPSSLNVQGKHLMSPKALDPAEYLSRPTKAERFVQTYNVYATSAVDMEKRIVQRHARNPSKVSISGHALAAKPRRGTN